jgi:hypothetical integral membrane protein (TIGR02206 family)
VDFFLSSSHLAALAATALLAVALPVAARRRPGAWTHTFSRSLGVLLLAGFVSYHVVVIVGREAYSLDFDLPLHLTDAVTVIAAIALWTWRILPFELTYFWGLTGAFQAVFTPTLDPDEGPSSFFYWQFFVTHSGVVVAALFLAFGVGLTARPHAVPRMFVATLAWALLAALGNLATGGNYMFLREKPETSSLLDHLGPSPWYIASAAAFALILFALLDLPFRRRRTAERRQRSAARSDASRSAPPGRIT